MADRPGLSEVELLWLIAWNIADGEWSRIDLDQASGRNVLLKFLSALRVDPREAAKESRIGLQQSLMALRQGSFEETQQESPFSRYAERNMKELVRAWMKEGEAGFVRKWAEVFPPGWEANKPKQEPVRIIVDTGDCEGRALEVTGAPDWQTRAGAEWWYLYHTFGKSWKARMHFTSTANEEGARFSIHYIHVFPNSHRRVFFRLPW
jgi:hypothetical protein